MEELRHKSEKLFLILCLLWGLIFLVVSPPFTGADECSHFWKIYLVSQGRAGSQKLTSAAVNGILRDKVYVQSGAYVPMGMYKAGYKNIRTRWRDFEKTNLEETKEILSYPLEKDHLVFNSFPVPSYTVFSYLPQAVLMKIMTFANINPGWIMYVLRLVSLITYTALVYAAIRITPVKKWMFFALGLLPTALYQSAGINTDGLTIGLGFLFFAMTLYLAFNNEVNTISTKQLLLYCAAALYFILCKFAYAPLLLIYFLIPAEKFGSRKRQILTFLYIALCAFALTLILFILNSIACGGTDETYMRNAAIGLLLYKPVIFVKAMIFTILVKFKTAFEGFVGSFGWGEVRVPFYCAVLYCISVLNFSLFNFEGDRCCAEFNLKQKTGFIAVFLAFTLFLFLVLYAAFQISDGGIIPGFFGRYFIPASLPVFLVFANKKLFAKNNLLIYFNLFLINYVLFVSLIRIIYRFYV